MKILTAWLRIYKSFGGEKWKSNVILTSFLCPGIVFGHFFIMNLVRIQPLLEWCSECSGGCWSECSVWRWFIIFSLESWKVRSIYETFFQRPFICISVFTFPLQWPWQINYSCSFARTTPLSAGFVVLRQFGGHPLLYAGCPARPLVRRLRSPHLRRSLLRIQVIWMYKGHWKSPCKILIVTQVCV